MITPYRIVAVAALVLATTLFTTLGHAQQDPEPDPRWAELRANERIESGLLVSMVTTFIVDGCDDIRVRRARSTPFLFDLARQALAMGYSREEVEAFIDDPVERARVEARADAYLAQNGAARGDAASLCRAGRDEIAAGSAIGRLLRRS